VRAFVGVTDSSWYQFLRARPDLNEVNFWRPGGQGFGALTSGEPFIFKTHRPNDRLVGGGFLSGSTILRLSEAWDFFGVVGAEADDRPKPPELVTPVTR